MNPYQILKIHPTSSPAEVKAAFKKRARETHPDLGGSVDEFNRIKDAYETLKLSASTLSFYVDTRNLINQVEISSPRKTVTIDVVDTHGERHSYSISSEKDTVISIPRKSFPWRSFLSIKFANSLVTKH